MDPLTDKNYLNLINVYYHKWRLYEREYRGINRK